MEKINPQRMQGHGDTGAAKACISIPYPCTRNCILFHNVAISTLLKFLW